MAHAATNRTRPALSLVLGACVLLGGASCKNDTPPATTAQPQPTEQENTPEPVNLAFAAVGLSWEAPESWEEVEAVMASRLVTWQPPIGGEAVQTFVFSFGDRFNQSVSQNVRRWSLQMRNSEGELPEPELETWELNGLHTTIATLRSQTIIGIPLSELELGPEGVRLVGAVVEGGPNGVLLFRLSGPAAMIDELEPEFLEMIRSVKLLDPPDVSTAP